MFKYLLHSTSFIVGYMSLSFFLGPAATRRIRWVQTRPGRPRQSGEERGTCYVCVFQCIGRILEKEGQYGTRVWHQFLNTINNSTLSLGHMLAPEALAGPWGMSPKTDATPYISISGVSEQFT